MNRVASSSRSNLAVVVVTYNGAAWIRKCLASTRGQYDGTQVYVVDNASTDDTVKLVRQMDHVILIEAGTNLGFGRGNNLGIREALKDGANYIFLLNQDAYLLGKALPDLVSYLEQRPEVSIVAPLHCSPTEATIDMRTFRGYLQLDALHWFNDVLNGNAQAGYQIFGVNAAGWLVRRQVFVDYGGFDPLYFMYGEDDDLLNRWAFHGLRFDLMPSARMVHLRESPPAPQMHGLRKLLQDSERWRSSLLTATKSPVNSTAHAWLVLLADGFWTPVRTWLLRREGWHLVCAWIGALRVACSMRSVLDHKRTVCERGPHFLDLSGTAAATGQRP